MENGILQNVLMSGMRCDELIQQDFEGFIEVRNIKHILMKTFTERD